MKVLALASYPTEAAATRYRLAQFVAPLAERGIELTIHPFIDARLFERLYQPGAWLGNVAGLIKSALLRFNELPAAGGLMGYGVNFTEFFRRAAYFVDKILKGTKPADIPVEQPTKFEMAVNMKTAKALGIKFPNSIMVQATNIIE